MSKKALKHLSKADPILAALIAEIGPYRLQARTDGTHFAFLSRSIVFQQLSGKAASTIWGRFQGLFPSGEVEPRGLLAFDDATLRSVGLSRQKIRYLRDFATRVESGHVPIDRVHELDDESIIESLTVVKGVGRWTVQMFLMFRLARENVLPEVDLGIQKAIQRAYGLRARPTPKRVRRLGERWQPYRTIACWYLWRSLDGAGAQI
jgi:DNA-3-methyladenine glycosylase II